MSQPNYLLFIDYSPISEELKKYFLQFNIDIVEQSNLQQLIPNKLGTPSAILIHWPFLKNNVKIMHQFDTIYPIPLIIINDIPDEEICIKVLESGADDFISKPINPSELHARINAINRRVQRATCQTEHEKEVYVFSNWRLYPASRRVFSNTNEELLLSTGEYDLLLTFVQQPHQVLEREHLFQTTKNSALNPFDRRIDVQISRLRQKISINANKTSLIKTIRNGGYMFTAEVTTLKEIEYKRKKILNFS